MKKLERNIYKKIITHSLNKTPANIEPLFNQILAMKISERINSKKEEILGR
jgi:hypothetical protein